MKYLFSAKLARHGLPLDQILVVLKAAKEWQDQMTKDGTFDCIYNFVEGGGIAIGNFGSAEDAFSALTNYPGRIFFDWEIKPLVDSNHAIGTNIARAETAVELQKQAS